MKSIGVLFIAAILCVSACGLSHAAHTKKTSANLQDELFAPLIADPRWPHFSMAYQLYLNDDELKNVGATSFGELLPFYLNDAAFGGRIMIGMQAAVFAVFDLDGPSSDLVNADYMVGLFSAYRKNNLSSLLRVFHQSSHLGDEYLLRNRGDRINLSYETLDLKVSYDFGKDLRVYAGSGYIFRKEPNDLRPWSVQYGLEFKSPRKYLNGNIRPIAGADVKNREENDWEPDVSLQAGFEIENEKILWNKFQLLLGYFNGFSPNGQFYERSIEYLSIGMHFYF